MGSTGSIGTQALDVIRQHRDLFEVELLVANTSSRMLIEQGKEFDPNMVVICDESKYEEVRQGLAGTDVKVFAGIGSVCDILRTGEADIVLTAMVGFSGLRPTIEAIKAGRCIALANKETLVAAGDLISSLAKQYNAPIIPVDSEHSAIFQSLQGERSPIEKLVLTGSGGPFLHSTAEEIAAATPAQALNHPRWKMGAKVTIDSASLMNKGLELIEARWLFNLDPSDIEIIIHPQSCIHSMVRFQDGAIMAQLGATDMRIPIQYAFSYPYRLPLDSERTDFAKLAQMTFLEPDTKRFPCLELARRAAERGGNMTCIMNGANEVAVRAFLEEKIGFAQIPEVVAHTMEKAEFINNPDIDAIFSTDFAARRVASEYINKL